MATERPSTAVLGFLIGIWRALLRGAWPGESHSKRRLRHQPTVSGNGGGEPPADGSDQK